MKTTVDSLEGFIESEVHIECSVCRKGEGKWGETEEHFAKELIRKGWRRYSGGVRCPSCARKARKKK